MRHEDEETSAIKKVFLRRLSAAAEFEISRDKTGGAARLLVADNDHMLPSLITLILSVQGQERSPEQHPHKHTLAGEQHAMPLTTHSVHAVLLETLSSGC